MIRLIEALINLCYWTVLAAVVSIGCLGQVAPAAEKAKKDDPALHQAEELFGQGRFVDAMPLFEKLVADYPTDSVVRERWAWCTLLYSSTLPDLDLRKRARVRARAIAVKAKELGDNSQILGTLLEVPEDGSEGKFSDRQEVDDAMKAAEADFARGNLDKARDGYLRVILLDPNNYIAALFTGDVYFKQRVYGSAGEWFSRAIQINPNSETAYRYWGDALAAMGKEDDARAKFIEGIVAEPYNHSSWVGLTNWLQRNKLTINEVRLKDGSSVTQKDEKNITITIDDSAFQKKNDPNGVAWMSYGMNRALWRGDKFKKEFPNELKYRRTMKEEADSLRLMITVLKEQKNYAKNLKNLDPALQSLIKIQEAGFLEPFVLLNRADNEIAQDYDAYRASNRDQIRRYLDEFVVPKTPATKN